MWFYYLIYMSFLTRINKQSFKTMINEYITKLNKWFTHSFVSWKYKYEIIFSLIIKINKTSNMLENKQGSCIWMYQWRSIPPCFEVNVQFTKNAVVNPCKNINLISTYIYKFTNMFFINCFILTYYCCMFVF